MKSARSKLLHDLRGKPVLRRTLENARQIGPTWCVVSPGAPEIAQLARDAGASLVVQDPPLGTGHAVMAAEASLRDARGELLILNGDVPLAEAELLRRFVELHRAQRALLTVLTTEAPDPGAYGRIVRRGHRLLGISEFLDAPPRIRALREINSGVYCARMPEVFSFLRKLKNVNQKGEYYLTDLVEVINKAGRKVACMTHPQWRELLGINDRIDLEEAAAILNLRKIRSLQRSGVSILSCATTFVGDAVEIGPDTIIHPFVSIEGRSRLGANCTVMPYTRVVDSSLGEDVTVNGSSVIIESVVERGAVLGPFCHLRGSSHILPDSKVGNFVEMKKTTFGPGAKAMHLTYLGDATVERGVNVGAGTITCNYDGEKKHPTHIEEGVFVGSGTELVAPVRVGRGAYIAAGSTITEDVPAGSLAIARARQVSKEGWVEQRKPSRKA